jgi:hypothetical protein
MDIPAAAAAPTPAAAALKKSLRLIPLSGPFFDIFNSSLQSRISVPHPESCDLRGSFSKGITALQPGKALCERAIDLKNCEAIQ